MKQYLIWIEVGGEQGDYICSQVDYMVCDGCNEEEAVRKWIDTHPKNLKWENVKFSEQRNRFEWFGRPIRIFELPERFTDNKWKQLKWMD